MSRENIPTRPVTGDDNETSRGEHKMASVKPPEQPLKCPRCDSPNTKFCYYNNYSLSQPRHFCKTCRRYWTKGGALRSVPIGGGCRKNKRTQSASRVSSGDSKDSATSSLSGGMKFTQGLSPAFTGFHSSTTSVFNDNNNHGFVSFGRELSYPVAGIETNRSCFVIDDYDTSGCLSGLQVGSYPIGLGGFKSDGGMREIGSTNVHSRLASSIESLSCLNQDLHWKLQQQRLAMLFGGETHRDGGGGVSDLPVTAVLEQENNEAQRPQPISFQNLGISNQEVLAVSNPTVPTSTKGGMSGAMTTEWFFENSYAPTTTTTTNNSGSNGNDNTSNWNGIQAWTDLHQYNAFP